jgi:predicted transcriptional regulator
LGKNRDRLGIIAAVLEASRAGSSKTHIMFKANLSFKLLEKYLTLVTEAGFVHLKDSSYNLTIRGEEFLERYKTFQTEFSKLKQSLDALGDEQANLEKQCLTSALCPIQTALEGGF